MTVIHQVLAGVGPYDAVSEQARTWRRLFEEDGDAGGDFGDRIDPRVRAGFAPLSRLDPAPEDLLVIRYSGWTPAFNRLLALPNPKLLVYHNVTPARFMWNHSAIIAVQCEVARVQLGAFGRAADVCVADSGFNAAELQGLALRDVGVVPILTDPRRLEPRGEAPEGEGPLILSVGRIAPNKRHDLVFAAFAAWQAEHAPDARLLVIGEPISPSYQELVDGYARDSGATAITFAGSLPQPEVNAAFAAADALLHLSDHEGFCIPLVEAFHFDLPVVAAPNGSMPGVAGDAALWADADHAVTAELLELAVRDESVRARLTAAGRSRLDELSYENTAAKVRAAVAAALA